MKTTANTVLSIDQANEINRKIREERIREILK